MTALAIAPSDGALIDITKIIGIVEDVVRSVVSMCELTRCVASEQVDVDGELVVAAHYGAASQPLHNDLLIEAQRAVDRRLRQDMPSFRVRLDHQFSGGHRRLPML